MASLRQLETHWVLFCEYTLAKVATRSASTGMNKIFMLLQIGGGNRRGDTGWLEAGIVGCNLGRDLTKARQVLLG